MSWNMTMYNLLLENDGCTIQKRSHKAPYGEKPNFREYRKTTICTKE